MINEVSKESTFLVTNASGRHINILNDHEKQVESTSPVSSEVSDELMNDGFSSSSSSKRKYHCSEPGCTKSFTTSGHLARHNRIHTGEKNFPCLFPGCQSRFSRQDNMMQHYRTHMSPKSRRTQKKVVSEDLHPRPRLHAHQRIRSDPYRVERPLTIDQHLNNYRRSLLSHPIDRIASSVKYNMPTPLGSVAASHMQKQQQQQQQQQQQRITKTSYPQEEEEEDEEEDDVSPTSSIIPSEIIFYQHKPLTFSTENSSSLPFTLLHPTRVQSPTSPSSTAPHTPAKENTTPPSSFISPATTTDIIHNAATTTTPPSSSSSSSQAGLLQLAHIVSTFG
ncbi:hypothetical protein INT47_001123 [Mucor saturninus]|uniref:C2H2-type domain-containing protein n=1 Tax=Mucor saturninus TaxID=64648 RepID=A0A8H7RLT0_9FUNG|nr:hypothetical protein INT47_001123 [Mucor saturninus]